MLSATLSVLAELGHRPVPGCSDPLERPRRAGSRALDLIVDMLMPEPRLRPGDDRQRAARRRRGAVRHRLCRQARCHQGFGDHPVLRKPFMAAGAGGGRSGGAARRGAHWRQARLSSRRGDDTRGTASIGWDIDTAVPARCPGDQNHPRRPRRARARAAADRYLARDRRFRDLGLADLGDAARARSSCGCSISSRPKAGPVEVVADAPLACCPNISGSASRSG